MSGSSLVARTAPERLATELLDSIHDATQAVLARIAPALEAEGLTPCTFWTLYRLGPGGEDHAGAIARRLQISMPSVTQSVDQLVDSGLVSRRRSEADRRVVLLEITPAGRRLLTRVIRRIDERLDPEVHRLPTADVRTAARVLRDVAARLREDDPPVPAREAA
jgi:MarR family transcriptional regulator, organic hydroperoxide resistance regulator